MSKKNKRPDTPEKAPARPRRSAVRRFLSAFWVPLVSIIALAVGIGCMYKVHEFSNPGPVIAVDLPQAPEEFTPKKMTYEVFGDLGSGGLLSYVDLEGHPHQVNLTELPWFHEETTTLTVVSASLSVQVHGDSVGCRILVNDVVKDEQNGDRSNADITCRVKSA